jgi:PAS domain S-box-containing protein
MRCALPEPGELPGLDALATKWAETLVSKTATSDGGITLSRAEIEQVIIEIAKDARAQVEQERAAAQDRFTTLYAASPVGIALTDVDGTIVEANPALGATLGRDSDALRGTTLPSLAATETDAAVLTSGLEQFDRDLGRDLRADAALRLREVVTLEHAADGPVQVEVAITCLPGDRPGQMYPLVLVRDTNDLHLLHERLRHQNIHDPLTGLPNSAGLSSRLEGATRPDASDQVA